MPASPNLSWQEPPSSPLRKKSLSGGSPAMRRMSSSRRAIGGKTGGADLQPKKIKMPTRIVFEGDAVADPEIFFMEACELGDYEDVRRGLESGIGVFIEGNDKGEMPVHKLSRYGNVSIIRQILDQPGTTSAGLNVSTAMLNWQCKKGKTPLYFAAEYGQLEAVQFLIDRGADFTLVDGYGQNILHAAVQAQALDVIRAILSNPKVSKDKILNTQDKLQRTPLHIASYKDNEDIAKMLMEYGANRELEDVSGLSPIALAGKAGKKRTQDIIKTAAGPKLSEAARMAQQQLALSAAAEEATGPDSPGGASQGGFSASEGNPDSPGSADAVDFYEEHYGSRAGTADTQGSKSGRKGPWPEAADSAARALSSPA